MKKHLKRIKSGYGYAEGKNYSLLQDCVTKEYFNGKLTRLCETANFLIGTVELTDGSRRLVRLK
jgi:hypothetical protein